MDHRKFNVVRPAVQGDGREIGIPGDGWDVLQGGREAGGLFKRRGKRRTGTHDD